MMMISSSIIYLLNGSLIHYMENNRRMKMKMELINKKVVNIRMNLLDKSNN
jgi:hypothetical protein